MMPCISEHTDIQAAIIGLVGYESAAAVVVVRGGGEKERMRRKGKRSKRRNTRQAKVVI